MSILVGFVRFSLNTDNILNCAFIFLILYGLYILGINLSNIINSMCTTFTLEPVLFSHLSANGSSVGGDNYSMFLAIGPLLNKSNKGSNKNKTTITPVAMYSGDEIKLAIKENRGKSGVYR
jgi:hypothetical protein